MLKCEQKLLILSFTEVPAGCPSSYSLSHSMKINFLKYQQIELDDEIYFVIAKPFLISYTLCEVCTIE